MTVRGKNIDNILTQVEQLDYAGKINLLEKVVLMLKKESEQKKKVLLTSIGGLGAEIWKGVDIDSYLENERQWD